MCIMMVMYRMVQGFPIVLGANRDEFYERCSHRPDCLSQTPAIWGGRDAQAGGTWLGVNEYGLVVGLTNRRLHEAYEPVADRRSRGLLCLDALRQRRASNVAELLASEPPDRYNAFNLLVFDSTTALWIAYDGKPEVCLLEPGMHILANKNLNDMETLRVRRAQHLLDAAGQVQLEDVLPCLARVCGDHEPGVQEREHLCLHRSDEMYGTVSSTILAISPQRHKSIYYYASGHPCRTAYQDYSAYLISPQKPSWTLPS